MESVKVEVAEKGERNGLERIFALVGFSGGQPILETGKCVKLFALN